MALIEKASKTYGKNPQPMYGVKHGDDSLLQAGEVQDGFFNTGANACSVVLSASAAKTATSTGTTAITGYGCYTSAVFELDVTAAATAAGDTLDVFIQTSVDGTNYVDIVAFTQVLGDGGAKRYYAKVNSGVALTMFENATALSAGVRNILGDKYRVRWVLVDATTDDASFTFSVTANFLQ